MGFTNSLFQNSTAFIDDGESDDYQLQNSEIIYSDNGETVNLSKGPASSSESSSSMHRIKMTKDSRSNSNLSGSISAGKNHPLNFWDCSDIKQVPSVERIRKFHVYDFDNTIFRSPSPNPSLYNDSTIRNLKYSEMLHNGGWWAYPLMLKNAGDGWNVESNRKWESLWNENIVELLKLSAEDEETLTIILTGRIKHLFTDIIKDILQSRDLKYDGLILKKGKFHNTLSFKTQVLTDILDYYQNIKEIVIYDDKRSQLNGFQAFLNEYSEAARPGLIYSLIPVFTPVKYLDPKTERELVEEYVSQHNQLVENGNNSVRLQKISLKKSFFYDAFIVDCHSKADVIEFLLQTYPNYFTEEYLQVSKFQSDFIVISRTKLPKVVEKKLRGDKKKFEWRITHFGYDEVLCAVRVEPVDHEIVSLLHITPLLPISSKCKSATTPIGAFQQIKNWIPVNDSITICTCFGQVISFKISLETAQQKKSRKKLEVTFR